MTPTAILLLLLTGLLGSTQALVSNATSSHPMLAGPYGPKKFWVHQSCTNRVDNKGNRPWEAILEDAIRMACNAKRLLARNPVDVDFAQVFRTIFNVDVHDSQQYFMPPDYRARFQVPARKTARAMALGKWPSFVTITAIIEANCQ